MKLGNAIGKSLELLLKASFFRHRFDAVLENGKTINDIKEVPKKILYKWFWQDYRSAVLFACLVGILVFAVFYFFFYINMGLVDSIIIGAFAFFITFLFLAKGTYDKNRDQVEVDMYKSNINKVPSFVDKYIKVLTVIWLTLVSGFIILTIVYGISLL